MTRARTERRAWVCRVLAVLALGACGSPGGSEKGVDDSGTGAAQEPDADSDGWAASKDCDDNDASIHPGAEERCDGVDQDCDGERDEDAVDRLLLYEDRDGDGFGDADRELLACPGAGRVADATDCNDREATVHPGAVEHCDGVDEDCNRMRDDDAVDLLSWFADLDGDGFGDPSAETLACTPPDGHVADNTDCDDSSALALPGGTEVCDGLDNDCDGQADADRVPSDFATIAEAIAELPGGTEICLEAGVYQEQLVVSGQTLHLVGAGGASGTSLDPSGLGAPFFTLRDRGELNLQDVGVQGITDDDGTAALVDAVEGAVTLERVRVDGNSWRLADDSEGVGVPLVQVLGGRLHVEELVVSGNHWDLEGRGGTGVLLPPSLLAAEGAEVSLVDVVVETNELRRAGAVAGVALQGLLLRTQDCAVELLGVELRDNIVEIDALGEVAIHGGLLALSEGTASVERLSVTGNRVAVEGATGDLESRGLVLLEDLGGALQAVAVSENTLTMRGGGAVFATGPLAAWGPDLDLAADGLELRANTTALHDAASPTQAHGGGACLCGGRVQLHHVDARANELAAELAAGGGLYLGAEGAVVSLQNSVIAGNLAGSSDALEAAGGGLELAADSSDVALDHLTIAGNRAEAAAVEGGGLRLELAATAALHLAHSIVTDSQATALDSIVGIDLFVGETTTEAADWHHNNVLELAGRSPDATDLAERPSYVDRTDPDPLRWDLQLDPSSPLVDQGAADCVDVDGTRCDLGAYGGADGSW